jgi:hypothetical protein
MNVVKRLQVLLTYFSQVDIISVEDIRMFFRKHKNDAAAQWESNYWDIMVAPGGTQRLLSINQVTGYHMSLLNELLSLGWTISNSVYNGGDNRTCLLTRAPLKDKKQCITKKE